VTRRSGNVLQFTRRDADEGHERREWVKWIRAQIKSGQLDETCACLSVRPASVLAIAKLLASGRYPSFWAQGVFAKAETLGSDADVGLSSRQVRRAIECLVTAGCIERVRRKGTTSLLRPKAREHGHYVRGSEDFMSAPDGHHVRGTADTMSADSTNYKNTDLKRAEASAQPAQSTAPNSDLGAWPTVRKRLSDEVGSDKFEAWFGKVTLASIENGIVTLQPPTRFIASYLSNHYEPQTLAAWRAHDPTIVAVRFAHRALRETGSVGRASVPSTDDSR